MIRNSLFALLLVLALVGTSNHNPASISYVESSSGLQTIALDGGRTELEFADINSDGHLDILSIGDHGSPYVNTQQHGIMVWFGNGTGANWSLFQNGNFGYGGIAIGDVNNDGMPDVGYGMHHNYSSNDFGDQLAEVALGDGTGMNWTPWDDSLGLQGQSWGLFSTDLGDVDNDGLLDLASSSFGCCDGLHVYKNLGTGQWRRTMGFLGGNSSMDLVLGDIDNDGNLDLAVAHQYGTAYFGDGTGNFTLRQANLPSPGNSGYRSVSLGDIDNDGSNELAFITSTGSVNVWKWNSTMQNWTNLSGNLPTSGSHSSIRLYDMNADGFLDVVTFGAGLLTIRAGNGGTSWTQIASFTTHASPGSYSAIAIGDVDHNGYPDIVLEAAESCGTFCTRNIIRLFRETTPYSRLTISPLFPRGFERFKNNATRFIEWLSASPASGSWVRLELSTSGSSGPWSLIADSIQNNGRHQWHIPDSLSSSNCFIRYTVFTADSSATSITPNPFIIGSVTGVYDENGLPDRFAVYQNSPNPFNASTIIRFTVPVSSGSSHVLLSVYDVLGKEVAVLVDNIRAPGTYETPFIGSGLPSGVYLYRFEAKGFTAVKKMILLK